MGKNNCQQTSSCAPTHRRPLCPQTEEASMPVIHLGSVSLSLWWIILIVVLIVVYGLLIRWRANARKRALARRQALAAQMQRLMNRIAELEGKHDSGTALTQDEATELSRLKLELNQMNVNQNLAAQQNIANAQRAVAQQVAMQTQLNQINRRH